MLAGVTQILACPAVYCTSFLSLMSTLRAALEACRMASTPCRPGAGRRPPARQAISGMLTLPTEHISNCLPSISPHAFRPTPHLLVRGKGAAHKAPNVGAVSHAVVGHPFQKQLLQGLRVPVSQAALGGCREQMDQLESGRAGGNLPTCCPKRKAAVMRAQIWCHSWLLAAPAWVQQIRQQENSGFMCSRR